MSNSDDLAFALKVLDADWDVKELIVTLLKLEESEDLREATSYAEQGLDQLKALIVARYESVVQSMKTDTVFATREERIKMQGGI